MNLKDKYVDLAVKIDGTVKFLIEAKSAGTELRDRHIEQAERYAAENNIRWVLLTNLARIDAIRQRVPPPPKCLHELGRSLSIAEDVSGTEEQL